MLWLLEGMTGAIDPPYQSELAAGIVCSFGFVLARVSKAD